MKYLYYDLGDQPQDSCVMAHLRGSAANVILLDTENFNRYRFGRPFQYVGGLYGRTPARLYIPHDGHWYLVVDCGGYKHRVSVDKVDVLPSDESAEPTEIDTPLVGASAQ